MINTGIYSNQLIQPIPGGIGRYIQNLLDQNDAEKAVSYIPISTHNSFDGGISWPRNILLNKLFYKLPALKYEIFFSPYRKVYSPKYLKGLDLIHSPSLAIPIARKTPLVTTVHDIAFLRFPESFTKRGVNFHKKGLKIALEESSKIIVPSRFIADELVSLDYDSKKIEVIHHGATINSDVSCEEVLEKFDLEKGSYALAVSTLEPRKNIHLLIDVFKEFEQKLVVVGPKGWGNTKYENTDLIKITGKVSDGELSSLYKNAKVFCSSSNYEGFGLPGLEAMTLGCVPFLSDISSHRELVANDDLLVKNDFDGWYKKLSEIYKNEEILKQLEGFCKDRAKDFSWKKSFAEHVEVYKSVV